MGISEDNRKLHLDVESVHRETDEATEAGEIGIVVSTILQLNLGTLQKIKKQEYSASGRVT